MKFKSIFKCLTAMSAVALTATSVLADGGPRRGSLKDFGGPPPFNWTGFYVGLHAGAGWAQQDATNVQASPAFDQAPGRGSLDGNGFVGGALIGYNFVLAPSVIAGVEADFSWTNLDNSATDINRFASGVAVGSGGHTWSRNTDWLASVRARLGFTITPNMLIYATGGFAWAGVDYASLNAYAGGCPNCGSVSISSTANGWVAGGGLELALNRNWLLRGEYLFYSLDGASGVSNFRSAPTVAASSHNFGDLDIHTVRAALSYKF